MVLGSPLLALKRRNANMKAGDDISETSSKCKALVTAHVKRTMYILESELSDDFAYNGPAKSIPVVLKGFVFSTRQAGSGGYGGTVGLVRRRTHMRHRLIASFAACRALGIQKRSRTLCTVAVNPPCMTRRWASANTSSVKRCRLGSSNGCFTSQLSLEFF